MRNNIRLKLDMAGRAMEFCRTHPDSNPSTALVGNRLGELVAQAKELLEQQRTSVVTATTAVGRKQELREIIGYHLASLAGISRAAAVSQPDLTVHRRLPRGRTSEPTFLTIARVAVAEALAHQEIFLKHGMPETLLPTMTAELDEYEAVVSRQRNGLATQVGAGAELEAVTGEIMGVVRHLDSLHRLRFRNDPELRAAWKSARNVAWPQPEPAQPAAPAAEVTRAA